MRRRSFLAAGGAAGLAATLGGLAAAAPAVASAAQAADDSAPSDSLRSLAAKIGLRIGTAVDPFDLDTPPTRLSSQASSRSLLRKTR
jgi:hypothetical protein